MTKAFLLFFGSLLGVMLWSVSVSAETEPGVEATPSAAALCTVPPRGAGSAATSKNKSKALTHLARARKAYEGRQFDVALQELRAAYDLDPLIDVLFNLAQACREAGRDAEALSLYELTLGETKDDAAKEDCERHIENLRVKLAAAEEERAAQALLAKDMDGALQAWERSYKWNKQPSALFQLAQTYRLAGRSPEAIAAYRRYLEAAPQHTSVLEAKLQLAELLATAEEKKALSLVESGQHAQAIPVWEEAYRIKPKPLYVFRTAEAQRLSGDKDKALASYERFLKESPQLESRELRQQAEEHIVSIKTGTVVARIDPTKQKPVYKRWWFWTVIGGAAAAVVVGSVTGAVLSRPTDPFTDIPLGNQRTLTPQ